ncbi:MAG: trigger factor [Gammaproteobacteria bacterium]
MHVSVETTTGLERRMTVEVPAEHIEQEVQNRLKSLAGKARMDGFRPGKVPFTVVERKFAGKVRLEVLGDMIRSSFQEAVNQKKLRPAGGPKIETLYEQPDKGLGYTATFEVYPEISLAPLSDLTFAKPVAKITESDVDNMIETLRKQRQSWAPVEREARAGDQLQVDLKMGIEGEPAKGEHSQQTSIVLGNGMLPKEIEEKLLGTKTGEELEIEHSFPVDFSDPARAGKAIHYAVKIIALYEPELPAIDEEFARNLGVESGNLDLLRVEVRANMERELDQAIQQKLKQQVMDALIEANPIDIPKALVDKEAELLLTQTREKLAAQGRKGQDLPAQSAIYEPTARRRVTLGLLLGDLIKTSSTKVDGTKVRELVDSIASTYEDPEEVLKWYYSSPERLAQIESLVLEDQVVEWVLARAQVNLTDSTFDALMNPQQTTVA